MGEEAFYIFLALTLITLFIASPILAIVAVRRVSHLRRRVEALEQSLVRTAPVSMPVPVAVPKPETVPVAAPPPLPPELSKPPAGAPEVPPAIPPQKKSDWESQIGIRVAAGIGIALLVIGAGFFVTYAIQQKWMDPKTRVSLGVLFGALLTSAGFWMERRKAHVLSRVLTAGGGAMMYFSIYAARGYYGLIGAPTAFAGLLAVSAAVFSLAMLYRSQWIALGALLGAFFVPVFTSSGTRDGLFFLGYIAILNLPVIALGLKRRWQWLYNTSATLTWVAWFVAAGEHFNGLKPENWKMRLLFVGIFFVQLTLLHMVKLYREETKRRPLDLARLSINSILTLLALYLTFRDAKLEDWIGLVLLIAAGVHVALAALASKRLPRFSDDALAFLISGATFVGLALPLQLDGVWVSAGWAIEGVILAWFAGRIASPLLRGVALGATALGLCKSQFYDTSFYETHKPDLFLNGRFAAGMLAAVSFYLQSRFLRPVENADADREASTAGGAWETIPAVLALAGAALVLVIESAFILELDTLPGLAMAAVPVSLLAALVWRLKPEPAAVRHTAWGLMLIAGIGVIVLTLFAMDHAPLKDYALLLNWPLWGLLAAPVVIALAAGSERTSRTATLHCVCVGAAMMVMTGEIYRAHGPWVNSTVTLLWAAAALVLVGVGLWKQRRYLRWFGLILFGVTTLKVLVVDLSELRGLPRIAAFFGAGLLLLVVSFVYHLLSRKLVGRADAESATKEP